jgi:hypothetical protein
MPKIDPEQERRRLSDLYAGQLDGELEHIAAQAHELAEVAKEALRVELAKRGLTGRSVEQHSQIQDSPLTPQLRDPPPPEPQEIPVDGGELESRNGDASPLSRSA